jgi:plastocyanin domain-containing protein
VAVTVKGGYTPDIIVVKAKQPVRLHFTRQESGSCSEMVLFPDFNQSAKLPQGEEVVVELIPEKPGEYGFQCQMGMLRGKLIVE